MQQWTWIKRALLRKGAIGKRGGANQPKAAGFVPVCVAAPVAAIPGAAGAVGVPDPASVGVDVQSVPRTHPPAEITHSKGVTTQKARTLVAFFVLFLTASRAYAAGDSTRHFDIRPQPMSSALRSFADQAVARR